MKEGKKRERTNCKFRTLFAEPAYRLAEPESRLQSWPQAGTRGEQMREAAERSRHVQGETGNIQQGIR